MFIIFQLLLYQTTIISNKYSSPWESEIMSQHNLIFHAAILSHEDWRRNNVITMLYVCLTMVLLKKRLALSLYHKSTKIDT